MASRSTSLALGVVTLAAAVGCGARSLAHGDRDAGEGEGGPKDGGQGDGAISDGGPDGSAGDGGSDGGEFDASAGCDGHMTECPSERPFCCLGFGLEGPRECYEGVVNDTCVEAPSETAVKLECREPGRDCPDDLSFCCYRGQTFCSDHYLRDWDCDVE